MRIVDAAGYQVLRRFFPGSAAADPMAAASPPASRIVELLGPELLEIVKGKTVIDFGCGLGADSVALARLGAKRVIGIDIRPALLQQAGDFARREGVGSICEFVTGLSQVSDSKADVIVSIDAFEHFSDPAAILRLMCDLLPDSGQVLISFGPTWFHPLGGHLPRPVFPWAHLVFTEGAVMRWRSEFKSDGAKRYCEVEGGLNQMTIARFEKLAKESPLQVESIECVPIRAFRSLHTSFTREWTTAVVRARLYKVAEAGSKKSRAAAAAAVSR